MKKILMSLTVLVALSGCVKNPIYTNSSKCSTAELRHFKNNTVMLLHVKQGQNVSEIVDTRFMGEPDYKQTYNLGNGVFVEGLYYPVGSEKCYDQHPVRYTHSPVFFEEGYLVGSGQDYLQWKVLPNVVQEASEIEKPSKWDKYSPVNKVKDFFNLLLK